MQLVMDGTVLGSIYALFAIGFTLVFGILDQLNLAHASVFSAGALVGIEAGDPVRNLDLGRSSRSSSWSGRCSGILIERIAFRPLEGRHDSHFAGLISSIALARSLSRCCRRASAPDTRRFPAERSPRPASNSSAHPCRSCSCSSSSSRLLMSG